MEIWLNEQLYNSKNVEMRYEERNEWLYILWRGVLEEETVKEGYSLALQYLRAKAGRKLVVDNQLVSRIWEGAADWLSYEWLPDAVGSGLQQLAWIPSLHIYSRFLADTTIRVNEGGKRIVEVKVCQQPEDAFAWLQKKNSE